jgi:hypothetical protein
VLKDVPAAAVMLSTVIVKSAPGLFHPDDPIFQLRKNTIFSYSPLAGAVPSND